MRYSDAEIALPMLRAGRHYERLQSAEREATGALLKALTRREQQKIL
jgi:hypothetical protein